MDSKTLNFFDYVMVSFVLVIPFSRALPNIIIIPAAFLYIYGVYKSRKISLSFIWLSLLVLSLIILLGGAVQSELVSELDFQKKFITGLLVFMLVNHVKNKQRLEYAFVASCTTAIIYNVFYFLIKTSNGVDFDLSEGETVYELLIIHRPYFAFMTVLSAYLIFKWIRSGKSNWLYGLVFFTIGFCFFISAKMGIILHLFLIGHHIFKSIEKLKLKHLLIILSILTIAIVTLLSNSYLKKRLRVQSDISTTVEKFKEYEIRTIIWDCSYQLLAEHWALGVNSHKQLVPMLTHCYLSKINLESKPKKYVYYKTEKFNTHNQFLDIWLIAGIPGVLILLSIFVIPLLKPKHYQGMLTVLTLFFFFMMVENIFQRQIGCFLFGIFLGLYAPRQIQWSWSK